MKDLPTQITRLIFIRSETNIYARYYQNARRKCLQEGLLEIYIRVEFKSVNFENEKLEQSLSARFRVILTKD